MNEIGFSFSDTIAGYVTHFNADRDCFGLRTSDGRQFEASLTPATYAELVRNLGDPYADSTGQMRDMLTPGRFLFAYGIFYPEKDGYEFDAKRLIFLGRTDKEFRFEAQDWWINQVRALADFYFRWQLGDGEIDYRSYRTKLNLTGAHQPGDVRQETDTISRLVYGFATAFLLTGEDRFLNAAEKGVDYLRDHMRFYDADEEVIYWYHGIDIKGEREEKVFASEFGDDFYAIPAYEQIYALVGPTQTYRITGDPETLHDIELTVDLFNRFMLDREKGGYFSHIDPVTLNPRSAALGQNRAKKNWNSVGDHAPAYLINLWLATGEKRYADMLVYTADTIKDRFPDYARSPFVQERFNEDSTPDTTWGWQQNRAVIGHNLKIAWNLMRIYHMHPNEEYVALSRKIADLMPSIGSDQQRAGWYDMMERVLQSGKTRYRHTWHDRKAWWQQEQAILAYLILAGSLKGPEYARLARESAAFYNAFFLDHDDGAVYFNVLANGIPYLVGTERFKGSHSMSGYHSTELCYLSSVYGNLLIHKEPMDFYFRPRPDGFKDGLLRVQPDILPQGSVRLAGVWIDGEKYTKFDSKALTVTLPDTREEGLKLRVRIAPNGS